MTIIFVLGILTRQGYTDFLAADTPGSYHETLKGLGLTKTNSLLALFAMSYMNQSAFVGISQADTTQYLCIRICSLLSPLLIVLKSDVAGTLRNHAVLLLLVVLWGAYFIFADWRKSR